MKGEESPNFKNAIYVWNEFPVLTSISLIMLNILCENETGKTFSAEHSVIMFFHPYPWRYKKCKQY